MTERIAARYEPDEHYLQAYNPSNLPPHILKLKLGTPVMLLRSVDIERGHTNGKRYVIDKLMTHSISLKPIDPGNEPGAEESLVVTKMLLDANTRNLAYRVFRKQLPIDISYISTINKAQGQTLRKCGLYLPNHVFLHGQLCVGISRVRARQHLRIYSVEK